MISVADEMDLVRGKSRPAPLGECLEKKGKENFLSTVRRLSDNSPSPFSLLVMEANREDMKTS